MQYHNIPEEFQNIPRWGVFYCPPKGNTLGENGTELKKHPVTSKTGFKYNPRDETTFDTFEEAVTKANNLNATFCQPDSIAPRPGTHCVAISMPQGYAVVDFDGDQATKHAVELLNVSPTWAEYSTSGVGVHAIYRQDCGLTNTKAFKESHDIDILYDEKFLVMTGIEFFKAPIATTSSLPSRFHGNNGLGERRKVEVPQMGMYAGSTLQPEDARALAVLTKHKPEIATLFYSEDYYKIDGKSGSEMRHAFMTSLHALTGSVEQTIRIMMASPVFGYGGTSTSKSQNSHSGSPEKLFEFYYKEMTEYGDGGIHNSVSFVTSMMQDRAPRELRRMDELHGVIPPPNWIIKGLLAEKYLGFLYGESFTGKSYYGLDLAAHVQNGLSYMGKRVNQTNVLYIATEGRDIMVERGIAAKMAKPEFAKLPFIIDSIDLFNTVDDEAFGLESDITWLKKQIKENEIGLLIVDTFSETVCGFLDENDNGEVAMFLKRIRKTIAEECNCCILFIDHTSKGSMGRGSGDLRGGGAKRANTDCVIRVSIDDDSKLPVVDCEKAKRGVGGRLGTFTFDVKSIGVDSDGESIAPSFINFEAHDDNELPKLSDDDKFTNGQELILMSMMDLKRRAPDPSAPLKKTAIVQNAGAIGEIASSMKHSASNLSRNLNQLATKGIIKEVSEGMFMIVEQQDSGSLSRMGMATLRFKGYLKKIETTV